MLLYVTFAEMTCSVLPCIDAICLQLSTNVRAWACLHWARHSFANSQFRFDPGGPDNAALSFGLSKGSELFTPPGVRRAAYDLCYPHPASAASVGADRDRDKRL